LLLSLIQICYLLINVVTYLVIAQFILSLLLQFNVVNHSNQFVMGVWRGINALLDPLLAPIRRVMPDTRPMDFSALALIVLLQILAYLLEGVARSTYAA
jgi:YggT family protein